MSARGEMKIYRQLIRVWTIHEAGNSESTDPGAFLVTYVVKLPTRGLLDNLAEPRTRRTSPKLLACGQTPWQLGPPDELDDYVRALMPHGRAAPGLMAADVMRLVASHPPLHCKLPNQLGRAGAESDGV